MNRLEAIRERLRRYTSDATNTDEKLEEGSISEWVMSSDGDMAWLLARVDELLVALESILRNHDASFEGREDIRAQYYSAHPHRENAYRKARKAIETAKGEQL